MSDFAGLCICIGLVLAGFINEFVTRRGLRQIREAQERYLAETEENHRKFLEDADKKINKMRVCGNCDNYRDIGWEFPFCRITGKDIYNRSATCKEWEMAE
jgi:hypothetical protein